MTTTDIDPPSRPMGRADTWDRSDRDDRHRGPDIRGILRRAEAWLDARGKAAWIVAMILGFVFAWPVGLFLLFYMIWSNRMFSSSCRKSRNGRSSRAMAETARAALRPSGNASFDAYKEATLRRLEDEQGSFEAFLERLREAKDKAEFDQFMEDRARAGQSQSGQSQSGQSQPESGAQTRDETRGSDEGWSSGPMRPAS